MLQKALQERCEIYISNQLYRIRRPRHLSLSVGVRIENDLVNLELDAGGIEMDELADILRNYRRRKKYYKLKNGEILDLQDDSIRETDELFQKLQLQDSQLQQKEIVLPGYRLYNIDALSEEQHIVQYDRSEIARQNDRLMKKKTFAVPEEFKEKLRDYQRVGFQWRKHCRLTASADCWPMIWDWEKPFRYWLIFAVNRKKENSICLYVRHRCCLTGMLRQPFCPFAEMHHDLRRKKRNGNKS